MAPSALCAKGSCGRARPRGRTAVLRGWMLDRPWAMAPAALCTKGPGGRALRNKQPPRSHEYGRRPPPTSAWADGQTTRLDARPALGHGARSPLRKRPMLSSTEEETTSAPTRVRPSARADPTYFTIFSNSSAISAAFSSIIRQTKGPLTRTSAFWAISYWSSR